MEVSRFYRTLAIVIGVYALIHPAVYLAALSWQDHALREQTAAGWTVEAESAPEEYKSTSGDGSPLLYQHLYYEPVLGPTNIFHALLVAAALLGVSALLAIAGVLLQTQATAPS